MQSAYGPAPTPPGTPGAAASAAAAMGASPGQAGQNITPENASTIGDFQELFRRCLHHNSTLQNQLNNLQATTDAAVMRLSLQNDQLQAQLNLEKVNRAEKHTMLVDSKNMCPSIFTGAKAEAYRPWAKKVKAYVNSKKAGFREQLESAERHKAVIDSVALQLSSWSDAEVANSALYDMLVSITQGDAQDLVELTPGMGFDAWRWLHERYAPIGEIYSYDKMTC